MNKCFQGMLFLFVAVQATADVRLPRIISDNMVLQQEARQVRGGRVPLAGGHSDGHQVADEHGFHKQVTGPP